MTRQAEDPSGVWLEVVAAVDYLAAGPRPALTVWAALAEALATWMRVRLDEAHGAQDELPWQDPDPLRSIFQILLATVGGSGTLDGSDLARVCDAALCRWAAEMAALFNDNRVFGHPRVRGGWPSVVLPEQHRPA